jgi:hypothetical protein
MKRNNLSKWVLLLALLIPLALVACGGGNATPEPTQPAQVEVEEPVQVEEPTAEPVEEPMEEPTEAPMEEPTEEVVEEPMETVDNPTLNGIETCVVAQDGSLRRCRSQRRVLHLVAPAQRCPFGRAGADAGRFQQHQCLRYHRDR